MMKMNETVIETLKAQSELVATLGEMGADLQLQALRAARTPVEQGFDAVVRTLETVTKANKAMAQAWIDGLDKVVAKAEA